MKIDESVVAALFREAVTYPGDDDEVGEWESEDDGDPILVRVTQADANLTVTVNDQDYLVTVYRMEPK